MYSPVNIKALDQGGFSVAQTIIADLPNTTEINPESYVIIERPGIGQGTYKATVGDLQDAITVHAKVENYIDESGNRVTKFTVTDILGTTEDIIVTPTATITDNGDNTSTITITDANGVTRDTVVNKVIYDTEPTQGSNNLLSSGTIYDQNNAIKDRILSAEDRIGIIENRESSVESRLIAIEERLGNIENRIYAVEEATEKSLIVESNNALEEPFKVNDKVYASFKDAFLEAARTSTELKLLSNSFTEGVSIPEGNNVVVNLNGYTLNVTGPGAGSQGTETNGMQLLMGSTITIKDGKIVFDDSRLKIGIQNYSNLTLDNVDVSGGPTIRYVVSNNHGHVVFKNGTKITASEGRVAFDVWYGMSPVYYDGVDVTIEDDSVQITGVVEFGKKRGASGKDFAYNAFLKYPLNMDLNLSILTKPCVYIDNAEEGTRKVRYLYFATMDELWMNEVNQTIMTEEEYNILVPVRVPDPPIEQS